MSGGAYYPTYPYMYRWEAQTQRGVNGILIIFELSILKSSTISKLFNNGLLFGSIRVK